MPTNDFHNNVKSNLSMSHKTYILIGHLPVWPLSVWHHFPHDNPVTPHIAGWGELPVRDCLWSRPPNRNLSALHNMQEHLPDNANTSVDLKETRLIKSNVNLPSVVVFDGITLICVHWQKLIETLSHIQFIQKFHILLHKDGNHGQNLIETLLPHVVQPTITLMNTNLGTHSWYQVSLSFIPCPNCRGAGDSSTCFPHLHYCAFIAKIEKFTGWLLSCKGKCVFSWWVVKLGWCSIDEHSGGIFQGLIIWRVWIMLFSLLCQGRTARWARERESKKRGSLAVRGEWQDIWRYSSKTQC